MDELAYLDAIEKRFAPKPSASGASLAGTDPVFAEKISALLDEAARQGRRLTIGSAKRDLATQARLRKRYETDPNAPLAARPTPHAPHVRGVAADLEGDLAWAHENAPRFGLYFPLLNAKGRHREDWHIQLDERGGAPSSGMDEESYLNSIEQKFAPRKEVGFGYQNQPMAPKVESPRREVGYGAQNQSPFAGARATGQLTTNTRNAGYGSQDQKPRVQLNDPVAKGGATKPNPSKGINWALVNAELRKIPPQTGTEADRRLKWANDRIAAVKEAFTSNPLVDFLGQAERALALPVALAGNPAPLIAKQMGAQKGITGYAAGALAEIPNTVINLAGETGLQLSPDATAEQRARSGFNIAATLLTTGKGGEVAKKALGLLGSKLGGGLRSAGLRKLTEKVGEEEALKLAAKSGDVEAGIRQIVNEANDQNLPGVEWRKPAPKLSDDQNLPGVEWRKPAPKLSDAFDAQPLPRKPSEFVHIKLSEDPGDVFDITDFNRPVENYLTSEGNVSILNSAERHSIKKMHPKQAETALPQVQEIIDSITASNGRAKPGNANKLKRLTEVKKALEQKAAQYGEQFPGATTNENAAQAMADSLAIPKMTKEEFDAYYNGLASLSEREKALKIRQAAKNAPRPKPTPGGRSGAVQKVDAEDVQLAARLAAVKMGRAVEDGEVMHNVRSAIRAMRLLSVGNRILDLTSNATNLGGQLIGKAGVGGWSLDRVINTALAPRTVAERGPSTVALGIKEINDWRKNAPQRIWQELKDLITTGNTEELHKFGITREAGGPLKYIGRATGSTDLIFRDFYRHMAELEIEKMVATNPKIKAIMTPEMRKLIIDEAELTGVFANDSWALGTMAKDAQGNYNNRLPMTGKGAVAQVHDIVNGERAVKGHLLGRKTSVDTKRIVERIPPDVSAAAKRATVANAGKIKGLLDGTIPFSQVQASTEAMREALKAAGFNNRGMVVYRVARKGEEEGARLVYSTRPSYLVAGMGEGDTLMRATIQPSDAGAIMHDGESLIFVVERPTLVVDRWSKEMRNAVMIVGDQVVPFPKVIANVAGTNTDYAFGAVKALIRRANVKELTIHDERVITELVRKNLVGVGTMLAGGYLYDKGYIKPVIDPNTHRATFGPVVAQGFGWAGWMLLAGATMAAYNDESLFPKKKKSSYDNPTGGVTADDAMQTAWNVGADMADSSAAGAVGIVGDMMRGDRGPVLVGKTAGKLISNAAPAFVRSHAKQGYPDIPGQEPKDVWERLKREGLGWLSLDNSVDYRQPRGFSESANMWDKSAVMKMKMGGLPHPALGQYGVGYRELSRQTWEPEDKYIERTLKARQVVNKLVDDTVKSKGFKSLPKDRQADLLLKIVTRVREVFGESARDTYGKK